MIKVSVPIAILDGGLPCPWFMFKPLIDPVTPNDPVISALPVYGKTAPPPEAVIVTEPEPPLSIRILFPAIICVTPPFKAYEELKAYDELITLPL